MKIISNHEMNRIEKLSFQEGGLEKEAQFMEQAGWQVFSFIYQKIKGKKLKPLIVLLCGKGNNAGDAYVAGRFFLLKGFEVLSWQIAEIKEVSFLCKKNHDLFRAKGGRVVYFQHEKVNKLPFEEGNIVIDGLFGTGFFGDLKEPYLSVITELNKNNSLVFSIDIPSGIDGKEGVKDIHTPVVSADYTVMLGLPKTGLFLRKSRFFLGRVTLASFGLEEKFIEQAQADFELITKEEARKRLPKISFDRHKYQAGHVSMLCGSRGMWGAAHLSVLAAMRAGCGIVKLYHSDKEEISDAVTECVQCTYCSDLSDIGFVLESFNQASACLIGPGLSLSHTTKELVQKLVPQLRKPLVLDADALSYYAENPYSLPAGTILTPHWGEFKRMFHLKNDPELSFHLFDQIQQFCEQKKIIFVLKGSPTFIFSPGHIPYVNIVGTPGMATAGSGDVLAGVITALLAQGISSHDAAVLGTYLHGYAGEICAQELTDYSMIASDLIGRLKESFSHLG